MKWSVSSAATGQATRRARRIKPRTNSSSGYRRAAEVDDGQSRHDRTIVHSARRHDRAAGKWHLDRGFAGAFRLRGDGADHEPAARLRACDHDMERKLVMDAGCAAVVH